MKNRVARGRHPKSVIHRRLAAFSGARAFAIRAFRAGAIADTFALTLALALSLAFAGTQAGAIGARAAVRADAAVLYQTRGLTRRAFLCCLRRATVTAPIAGAVASEG